jgi:hypothetical protein
VIFFLLFCLYEIFILLKEGVLLLYVLNKHVDVYYRNQSLIILLAIILPLAAVQLFRRFISTNTAIKTPNILLEFIKAKKEKVCPWVEFTD